MKLTLIISVSLLFLFSCQSKTGKVSYDTDPNNRQVTIREVIQTASYTYLKVTENRNDYWIAVTTTNAGKGDVFYYSSAMEMDHFYSKDLDRTFDKIYFVGDLSSNPIPLRTQQNAMGSVDPSNSDMRPTPSKLEINIAPREGSISIAELYANKEKYANELVKVTGEVTRFNPGIMSRNWVHLQDGTDDNGNFDLTVTTLDHVAVGDVVIIEGRLSLDKDFGAGYVYGLIVENANVTKVVMQ
jgi:hypothetical protein